jgi:hypothetical protein
MTLHWDFVLGDLFEPYWGEDPETLLYNNFLDIIRNNIQLFVILTRVHVVP